MPVRLLLSLPKEGSLGRATTTHTSCRKGGKLKRTGTKSGQYNGLCPLSTPYIVQPLPCALPRPFILFPAPGGSQLHHREPTSVLGGEGGVGQRRQQSDSTTEGERIVHHTHSWPPPPSWNGAGGRGRAIGLREPGVEKAGSRTRRRHRSSSHARSACHGQFDAVQCCRCPLKKRTGEGGRVSVVGGPQRAPCISTSLLLALGHIRSGRLDRVTRGRRGKSTRPIQAAVRARIGRAEPFSGFPSTGREGRRGRFVCVG